MISQYEESSDIEEDLSVSTDGAGSRKRTRYVVLYKCSVKGRHNKFAVLVLEIKHAISVQRLSLKIVAFWRNKTVVHQAYDTFMM